jgi:hypothetical protein
VSVWLEARDYCVWSPLEFIQTGRLLLVFLRQWWVPLYSAFFSRLLGGLGTPMERSLARRPGGSVGVLCAVLLLSTLP